MRPWTRRRRFTFLPVSVRFWAATTISGICRLLKQLRPMTRRTGGHPNPGLSPISWFFACRPGSHEQARDGRLLVDVADGLAHQLRDGQDDDLLRAPLLVGERDRIGDDEPAQRALLDLLQGLAGEDGVRGGGQ